MARWAVGCCTAAAATVAGARRGVREDLVGVSVPMLVFFIGATATLQPSSMPLPRSPPAAAAQAAKSTMKALRTSSPPVRLQIQIHGESVEEEDPLPVLSLCAELVEVLGDSQFANMHFFFDDAHAARAWQQLAPAAAACTRSSVLCEATGEPGHRSVQVRRPRP